MNKYLDTTSEYNAGLDVVTFTLVRCQDCGFVFTNPRPIPKDLQLYYPQDCPHFETSTSTLFEKLVFRQLGGAKISEPAQKNGQKVLDVGFGPADFLIEKYNAGYECYGVDTSQYALDAAYKKNPELKLSCGSLEEVAYPDNHFDLVNLSHVVEHMYDPVGTLKEVYRITKKSGVVQIFLPNLAGLYYFVAGKSGEYFVPQHLNFFTPKTMQKLMWQAGFVNSLVKTVFGNNLSYFLLHNLGIQKSFYKKTLFNPLFGLFVLPVEVVFDKGDVISVRASK